MPEIDEKIKESIEHAEGGSPLNSAVAILVAIAATLMALCNIKDEKIVEAMSHAQAMEVDTWSNFQAQSTKQHLMQYGMDQAELRLKTDASLTSAGRASWEASAAKYDSEVKRYETKKETIQKDAENFKKEYERLDQHNDQFHMADAFLSISIALAGITALTHRRWLFFVALAVSAGGFVMGLAGFLGRTIHLEWLARILAP